MIEAERLTKRYGQVTVGSSTFAPAPHLTR